MDEREKMDVLKKLEEKAYKDIKTVTDKPDISPTEWSRVNEVLCVIEKCGEFNPNTMNYGYSQRNMPRMSMDGYSMARSRDMSTGRYISRDSGYGMYDSGNSQHSIEDRMVEKLEQMMDSAGSDYEREQIRKEIMAIRSRM